MRLLDVMTSPWAIAPAKLSEIREIYLAHMRGPRIEWKDMEARVLNSLVGNKRDSDKPYCVTDGVAVIDIMDVLTKNAGFFSYLFGASSMTQIGEAIKAALIDPAVNSILLHVDSPGGTVDGTQELAETVFSVRGKKPIIAYTDGMMTSASYWIGSSADKVYISGDTTEVGSIGTIFTHIDQSAWDEQMGDKYTHIVSGKYKDAASRHKPLSKEGRAYLQDQVDYLNGVFIDGVAKNRGVTSERALEMADGARIYIGKQAIDAGLVDGVSTYDQLMKKMTAGSAVRSVYFKSEKEGTMDINELKDKFPAVYQAILDQGKTEGMLAGAQAGKEAGIKEGREAGAAAERQRIVDVRAQFIPGHEALIESLVNDGKTTGPEAAMKVLAAEKEIRKTAADKIEKDAEAVNKLKHNATVEKPYDGKDFMALVDEYVEAHKCSKTDGIKAVMKANPKAHAAYIKKVNEGKEV
jgi:signal peptide peptidase SppA